MTPNQVAIIGTGVGIRTHLPAITANDKFEVLGVVGSTTQRAAEHLSAAGYTPELAATLPDLLADHPDLVCLTTSPGQRLDIASRLECLGPSAVVLVEKPLGATSEQAADVLAALGSTRIVMDFQLRALPAFVKIRRAVTAGLLGTVYDMSLMERTSAFRTTSLPPWQQARSAGGGQALAMGSHLLDLGVFLSGSDNYDSWRVDHGRISRPAGTWTGAATVAASDLADETFTGELQRDATRMRIFTTCISPAERSLEVRLEGTEGTAEFTHRDGRGRLVITDATGGAAEWIMTETGDLIDGPGPDITGPSSAFRVAYPEYLAAIGAYFDTGALGLLASGTDGLANARLLDQMTAQGIV